MKEATIRTKTDGLCPKCGRVNKLTEDVVLAPHRIQKGNGSKRVIMCKGAGKLPVS